MAVLLLLIHHLHLLANLCIVRSPFGFRVHDVRLVTDYGLVCSIVCCDAESVFGEDQPLGHRFGLAQQFGALFLVFVFVSASAFVEDLLQVFGVRAVVATEFEMLSVLGLVLEGFVLPVFRHSLLWFHKIAIDTFF